MADIEQAMPIKLTQALVNPLFLILDGVLRSGHRIGLDELDDHTSLMDFQEYFEEFYGRYNVGLIRMPERFFYLRLRSTTFTPRPALFKLDVIVGRILCHLYLSPERLTDEGVFIQQELYGELLTLIDEVKLLKLVSNCSTGPDIDRQEPQEKVRSPLNRLCRLGMVWFLDRGSSKFYIMESVFRLDADVHGGDDPREVQRRSIHDGEAVVAENRLRLSDGLEENRPDSGEEG